MPQYYLAIDAGSGRAVVFDHTGRQRGLSQEEWTHISEAGVPGSMSFDCAANWPLLARCTRRAIADAGVRADEIAAISSTSMREGIVVYDAAGTELWACSNVDGRATGEVAIPKVREATALGAPPSRPSASATSPAWRRPGRKCPKLSGS